MFTQDEIRARYLSRKMAYLDRLAAEGKTREALDAARKAREEALEALDAAREALEDVCEARKRGQFFGQIMLFQELLKGPQTSEEDLSTMSNDELQCLADTLIKRLTQQK